MFLIVIYLTFQSLDSFGKGSEGGANTASVGAGVPWAGGSEAGIIAGRGESTEMALQRTRVQTSWIPKSICLSDLLGFKWDNVLLAAP